MNRILIIGSVWVEPKSSAAGRRILQLIEALQSADYEITFASSCVKTNNAFDLEQIHITQKTIKLNDTSFDDFIKELDPNIVIFDRFMTEEQFGWRVTENCPNALRILDTEDLHSLRKGRQQAVKDNKPFGGTYLFNDTAKREIASIYRCDLSLIISEEEVKILENQFNVNKNLLLYLPFMLDEMSLEAQHNLPKFEERNHFVTIGNFLHAPNYDSILYLKKDIWSLIRKQLPKAELHIYGAYASQKVEQLINIKDGFLIKGFAKSADEIMQNAKVCLAPLRFGAGLKGKLIDAMQNGTPCVTTGIGAEGMFGNMVANGFVKNDPKAFANKAVELYTHEILWKDKQQKGFEIVSKRFNKLAFRKEFLDKIKQLQNNLQQHRSKNFIGQMLHYHTLQSTKYMSKWIEAKKGRN